MFFCFIIICIGNTQEIDENEYITVKALFFNYNEEGIHFSVFDENGTWYDEWQATVKMKVVSEEYKNLIFGIVIGENPIRDQLKGSNVIKIKINKYYLEEYLYHNGNYHIFSSSIILLE